MGDEVEFPAESTAQGATAPSATPPATSHESRAMERVSDADRERAGELVLAALSDGRLELDEIDDRLGAVLAARTRGDLEAALIHLPGADALLGTVTPHAPQRAGPPVLETTSAPLRRDGQWALPPQLTIRARTSPVYLDLTEADLPIGDCSIELDLRHCSLRLVVPDGVRVDTDGVVASSSPVSVRSPKETAGPTRLVIYLHGSIYASSVSAGGPGRLRRRALRKAGRRST